MEREIKLSYANANVSARAEEALWRFFGVTPQKIALHARYYDTKTGLLFQNGVCFRLRIEGERHVAAVKAMPKGAAKAENGFFQRHEWEVCLPAPKGGPADLQMGELDLQVGLAALLPQVDVPSVSALLQRAQTEGLMIQTETSFTRRFALVTAGETVFCAAFDQGTLGLAPKTPFAEVELELVSGPVGALLQAAEAIAARLGLAPMPESKLARALKGTIEGGSLNDG